MYCYQSRINNQEFCIGSSYKDHLCTDINRGIRFVFNINPKQYSVYPMRFNRVGETKCQNYDPDYLQNLARSLGYSKYTVNLKKYGGNCKLVWLDSNGEFQSAREFQEFNTTISYPFDIEFWN